MLCARAFRAGQPRVCPMAVSSILPPPAGSRTNRVGMPTAPPRGRWSLSPSLSPTRWPTTPSRSMPSVQAGSRRRDYHTLTEADHRQHPSGRVGRPDDITRACLFLADPRNDFINGANLVVDGGMSKKMILPHLRLLLGGVTPAAAASPRTTARPFPARFFIAFAPPPLHWPDRLATIGTQLTPLHLAR